MSDDNVISFPGQKNLPVERPAFAKDDNPLPPALLRQMRAAMEQMADQRDQPGDIVPDDIVKVVEKAEHGE